jgi:hypothetical protein
MVKNEVTEPESRVVSATLPVDLIGRVDAFCADRVLGRAKFVELACERLLSTAPPLPGTVENVHDGQGRLIATYGYGVAVDPEIYEDEGPGTLSPMGAMSAMSGTDDTPPIDEDL